MQLEVHSLPGSAPTYSQIRSPHQPDPETRQTHQEQWDTDYACKLAAGSDAEQVRMKIEHRVQPGKIERPQYLTRLPIAVDMQLPLADRAQQTQRLPPCRRKGDPGDLGDGPPLLVGVPG